MLRQAINGTVAVGNASMDYAAFGRGRKHLVMIPGLGDGLTTVRGLALPFALMYRAYAKDYRVHIFSRPDPLEDGCTTRDMARDLHTAMARLGIGRADVLGISQGGMIAQHLAIDFPGSVNRLVLAVTLSRPNDVIRPVIGRWISMAQAGDYMALMTDTAEKSYSERRLRAYRPLYPILGRVGKPKDFHRFLVQARSCLCHDAHDALDRIACPTLVIGACEDRIVGVQASSELAERIPDSRLFLYERLGHAAYEEAGDFHARVLRFLTQA